MTAHVKNTGRCRELLTPGAAVFLQHQPAPGRKTQYTLTHVQKGKRLVHIDSQAPNRLVEEARAEAEEQYEQLELFTDTGGQEEEKKQEELRLKKERSLQEAMLSVKKKYGKNAMLKGMNLQEGATAMERNSQIGGHKA